MFAINAHTIERARPTSRIAGLGFLSTVLLSSVLIYQRSVKPGISRRMEKGMTIAVGALA